MPGSSQPALTVGRQGTGAGHHRGVRCTSRHLSGYSHRQHMCGRFSWTGPACGPCAASSSSTSRQHQRPTRCRVVKCSSSLVTHPSTPLCSSTSHSSSGEWLGAGALAVGAAWRSHPRPRPQHQQHHQQRRPARIPHGSRLQPPSAAFAAAALPEAAASAAAAAALGASTGAAVAAAPWSQWLAVGLGYAVMVGSLFRSVPQIVKILQARSVEGLSLMSNVVELCCYTVIIAYNLSQGYPFNTFGEVCACWAQDLLLVALIFHYTATPAWAAAAATAAFAASCWLLLSPWFPPHLLAGLQAATIIIMALGSRLPQILLNMQRGNSGVLSVTTCLLNVAGNAARTFTTLVLTGDTLLLGGILTQGAMNSVLLWQSLATAAQRGELWGQGGAPGARPWGGWAPLAAGSGPGAAAAPGNPGTLSPRPAT